MMYWRILWRSLCQNRFQTCLSLGAVLLSTALLVLVVLLSSGLQAGFTKAASPFPMVAGSRGSNYQLLLNTVFLQDVPLNNMQAADIERLRSSEYVQDMVLLGFGDNYRGHRIVGTTENIFSLAADIQRPQEQWLSVAEGRSFSALQEAVVGSRTAAACGLKLGDSISSLHGLGESRLAREHAAEHEHGYTVVGIMAPSGTPYDDAVLVPLASLWEAHENAQGQATAAVIVPRGYGEAMVLGNQYQNDDRLQLIYPAQTMLRLFNLLLQGRQLMQLVLIIMACLALLMIMLIMYWSTVSRRQERLIMQMLGAGRRRIMTLFLGEGGLLVVIGISGGALLGHGLFALFANWLGSKTALSLPQQFTLLEGGLLLGLIIAGFAAVLLPVYWTLYCRRDGQA